MAPGGTHWSRIAVGAELARFGRSICDGRIRTGGRGAVAIKADGDFARDSVFNKLLVGHRHAYRLLLSDVATLRHWGADLLLASFPANGGHLTSCPVRRAKRIPAIGQISLRAIFGHGDHDRTVRRLNVRIVLFAIDRLLLFLPLGIGYRAADFLLRHAIADAIFSDNIIGLLCYRETGGEHAD